MATKVKFARMCKEKMVEEIIESIKAHPHFIITKYMGCPVSSLEDLRRTLKRSASDYLVVKNSLLKIAFEQLNLKDECAKISSGMGISLSGEDIIATCKALSTFAKANSKFKIEGAVIDGQSVSQEKVAALALLPSKQVLLAQVVTGIKSPITGFVNVLGGVLRKFVYVVDAIKTSKEQAPEGAQK